ncbi:MAG: pitrilysin family protein [Bacteroidota bacterium]
MPNRQQRPPIYDLDQLHLPKIDRIVLDNQIPVYVINQGTSDALKLEIVFNAGRPYEQQPMIARACAAQIKEGSRLHTTRQIGELMDFYGSSLKVPVDMDFSCITLYTLRKHFAKVVPILEDLLLYPTFPKQELEHHIERRVNQLEVEISKGDVLAYRSITEQIFGSTHPYGYNSTTELYKNLNRKDLLDHFHTHYHAGNCSIFICGTISNAELDILSAGLSRIPYKPASQPNIPVRRPTDQSLFIEQKEALQTAIRFGLPLFERAHRDYPALYFINTILGGYFGSRLMANLREEKGYTYNISSSIDAMRFDGSWIISTEVGNEFVDLARKEIFKEITKLQQELVEDEELQMVRNYVQGTLLSMIDGSFNTAELVRNFITNGVPLEGFNDMVNLNKNLKVTQIRSLFQHYLPLEQIQEVVVGPKAPSLAL